MLVHAEFEERYWYPDSGGIVWLSGYSVVDEDGRFLARDAPELHERGIRIAAAAGAAKHHAEALASDDAAPGRPITLRRDPGNEHDPNAIAVETSSGAMLGFVPRELAAELAPELDAGTAWSALVLREQRASPRDPRTGVTLLLARAPAVELTIRPRRP